MERGKLNNICLNLLLSDYTLGVFRTVRRLCRNVYSGKKKIVCPDKCVCGKVSLSAVTFLSFALLTVSALLYGITSKRLGVITNNPIKLPVGLSSFPFEIGKWSGKDIALSESIQRAARNDDYLNRTYTNRSTNKSVNVYVAFTARPRTMLGHRPTVCYPASGWVHDGTVNTEVSLLSGRIVPCLLHRFHMPAPKSDMLVVLNYYIVNGELTNDEGIFSGIFWRTPNIRGNPARYVAQVQISSAIESAALAAAREMTEKVLDLLPDINGKTKATGFVGTYGDDVKGIK